MTQEDIIRMAREAGGHEWLWEAGGRQVDVYWDMTIFMLERFAALVATAEREACAQVCDGMDHNGVMIAAACAAAIRARSKQ